MRRLVLAAFFLMILLAGSAVTPGGIPDTIEALLSEPSARSLSADSVYYYLRQVQERHDNTTFYVLAECEMEDTAILVYMMYTEDEISVYACASPFVVRYPSTLLLWRLRKGKGVSDWYEIKDNVIHTHKLCDFWERIYISSQMYTISGGKFRLVGSSKVSVNDQSLNLSYTK